MLQRIVSLGKLLVCRLARLWSSLPRHLRRKIQVALSLLAVGISAIVAVVGQYQHVRIETAIQHQFQVVAALDEALTLMINAETGMRGYLLTKREEFLQPYAIASQRLSGTTSRIRALIELEQGNDKRLDKLHLTNQLQELINRQMSDLAWQKQYMTSAEISADEIFNHLILGKQLMDEIRFILEVMQNEEWLLLTTRIQKINSIQQRGYLAIFLALIVGLGSRLATRYFLNSGVIHKATQPEKDKRCLLHEKPSGA